ncbi:hypothetical protein KIN20_013295 [Parelaphostrongylus tenuis]|uniref:Uncharacterized protein n=1 Tax=Parelaphostrongylus tenuis TaxID=148309 RepID=A0AAD5MUF7_PARTN|nr:hypothetical protein KIN20_013295 [Parelaphostrongylus tenuis]
MDDECSGTNSMKEVLDSAKHALSIGSKIRRHVTMCDVFCSSSDDRQMVGFRSLIPSTTSSSSSPSNSTIVNDCRSRMHSVLVIRSFVGVVHFNDCSAIEMKQ